MNIVNQFQQENLQLNLYSTIQLMENKYLYRHKPNITTELQALDLAQAFFSKVHSMKISLEKDFERFNVRILL